VAVAVGAIVGGGCCLCIICCLAAFIIAKRKLRGKAEGTEEMPAKPRLSVRRSGRADSKRQEPSVRSLTPDPVLPPPPVAPTLSTSTSSGTSFYADEIDGGGGDAEETDWSMAAVGQEEHPWGCASGTTEGIASQGIERKGSHIKKTRQNRMTMTPSPGNRQLGDGTFGIHSIEEQESFYMDEEVDGGGGDGAEEDWSAATVAVQEPPSGSSYGGVAGNMDVTIGSDTSKVEVTVVPPPEAAPPAADAAAPPTRKNWGGLFGGAAAVRRSIIGGGREVLGRRAARNAEKHTAKRRSGDENAEAEAMPALRPVVQGEPRDAVSAGPGWSLRKAVLGERSDSPSSDPDWIRRVVSRRGRMAKTTSRAGHQLASANPDDALSVTTERPPLRSGLTLSDVSAALAAAKEPEAAPAADGVDGQPAADGADSPSALTTVTNLPLNACYMTGTEYRGAEHRSSSDPASESTSPTSPQVDLPIRDAHGTMNALPLPPPRAEPTLEDDEVHDLSPTVMNLSHNVCYMTGTECRGAAYQSSRELATPLEIPSQSSHDLAPPLEIPSQSSRDLSSALERDEHAESHEDDSSPTILNLSHNVCYMTGTECRGAAYQSSRELATEPEEPTSPEYLQVGLPSRDAHGTMSALPLPPLRTQTMREREATRLKKLSTISERSSVSSVVSNGRCSTLKASTESLDESIEGASSASAEPPSAEPPSAAAPTPQKPVVAYGGLFGGNAGKVRRSIIGGGREVLGRRAARNAEKHTKATRDEEATTDADDKPAWMKRVISRRAAAKGRSIDAALTQSREDEQLKETVDKMIVAGGAVAPGDALGLLDSCRECDSHGKSAAQEEDNDPDLELNPLALYRLQMGEQMMEAEPASCMIATDIEVSMSAEPPSAQSAAAPTSDANSGVGAMSKSISSDLQARIAKQERKAQAAAAEEDASGPSAMSASISSDLQARIAKQECKAQATPKKPVVAYGGLFGGNAGKVRRSIIGGGREVLGRRAARNAEKHTQAAAPVKTSWA